MVGKTGDVVLDDSQKEMVRRWGMDFKPGQMYRIRGVNEPKIDRQWCVFHSWAHLYGEMFVRVTVGENEWFVRGMYLFNE